MCAHKKVHVMILMILVVVYPMRWLSASMRRYECSRSATSSRVSRTNGILRARARDGVAMRAAQSARDGTRARARAAPQRGAAARGAHVGYAFSKPSTPSHTRSHGRHDSIRKKLKPTDVKSDR